jgi:LPXTG-site transpeptidase (sortase) family protein
LRKGALELLTSATGAILVLSAAFLTNFFVLSPLSHSVAQNGLRNAFASQTSLATAPTGEKDYLGHVLADGAPIAQLVIPSIGVNEIVVEGTDSNTMRSGVGHRRDTVLPGQEGMTVIFGRAWTYGGPFGALSTLKVGDEITTYTGQGKSTYKVSGIRKAGDKGLPPVTAGSNHLVLVTTVGEYYMPQSVIRVDADLQGKAFETGIRVTKWGAIPSEGRELGIDSRYTWVLALTILGLALVQVLGRLSLKRFGRAKTWLVFAPLFALTMLLTIDQATRLLPNLL